jgi:hypothetical protein
LYRVQAKRFPAIHSTSSLDKPGIHDIRLRFSVKGIWSILSSSSSDLISNKDLKNNKYITLNGIDLKDHIIKITVHRTNIVSVIVACSDNPIPIDIMGLAKLTSGLTSAEERLQRLLIDYYTSSNSSGNSINIKTSLPHAKYLIPSHMPWIVTMWHFGQDSLTEYSGEKFEISWKEGLEIFRIFKRV